MARGYGTGVGASEAAAAEGGVHGFPAGLTSFIGRAGPVREVAVLLDEHRLVTVTGPGGVGKTRLADQVARRVASQFADGAWLAELALVQDGAQVPGVVAAALGVREQPGIPVGEMLALVLAQQLSLSHHAIRACPFCSRFSRPRWLGLATGRGRQLSIM